MSDLSEVFERVKIEELQEEIKRLTDTIRQLEGENRTLSEKLVLLGSHAYCI